MNRIRLIINRIFRSPAVTGPYRLYVRRIPTGAMLDVEHYLIATLHTIADNPDLLDLVLRLAEDRGQAREHDGWEPDEHLTEQLVTALGYELPLYGDAVSALADRLRALAPTPAVVIPAQREAGAA
ncbi:MAG: hypothetical protein HOV70_19870 [Streptomyces sp.]|nr:hypothetical protein [Streptomyces sp.]